MKRLSGLLSVLLTVFLLVQPLQAALVLNGSGSVSALRNTLIRSALPSRIQSGMTLSAEDAAMRLYYLQLITGTGTEINGGISFDLDRDLTRLEGAVMAVRLMGAEDAVLAGDYVHPYVDVPDWASAYIGYLYTVGLTEVNTEWLFQPDVPASEEVFMSYMLYALGYRMQMGDYSLLTG